MNNPKISIIVPVYKAEKFLYKCVDSILKQTEQNFELLLVDDGSPDHSGAICDAYAQKDSRVRVIHQENGGVSLARSRGIQEAQGEYLGFVDSDDWIAENMYEQMLSEAERSHSDIVMCDALTVYDNGTTQIDTMLRLPETCNLDPQDLYPDLLLEFAGAVWRCIYKRSLIIENQVAFPEGLKFSEDRIFNIYAMAYAKNIRYIKMPLYMRFVNMESCVNRYHHDHFCQAKYAARETQKAIMDAWNKDAAYHKAYLRQFVDASCSVVRGIANAGGTVSLIKKIGMMDTICNDPDLRSAFFQSGYLGEYGQWVLKKRVLFLCLYSDAVKQKLENINEVYTKAGIMGVIHKCVSKLRK